VTVADTVVVTVRNLGSVSPPVATENIGDNKVGALPSASLLLIGLLGLLRRRRARH
jgi:uncharacterized protein (TIGR03382 family)